MADGFLGRWSQRKLDLQRGRKVEPEPPVVPATTAAAATTVAPATPVPASPVQAPEPAPPTLDDVKALTAESDFSAFTGRGVQPEVSNAAMKKLFSDPHYNVMDGLDTYIDDYSVPSPLPASMLKKMAQARFLGLVTEETDEPPPAVPAPTASATDPLPDEDPDLRLQPHDAAGREGPGPGAGEDPRREP